MTRGTSYAALVVIRPVAFAAPSAGSAARSATTSSSGYTGAFWACARGLVPAVDRRAPWWTTRRTTLIAATAERSERSTVVVPAGTTYARFSLFDRLQPTGSDLDLYVYQRRGAAGGHERQRHVGRGGQPHRPGRRRPTRCSCTAGQTDGPDANYTLFTWLLGSDGRRQHDGDGSATATTGQEYPLTISYADSRPGRSISAPWATRRPDGMPTTFVSSSASATALPERPEGPAETPAPRRSDPCRLRRCPAAGEAVELERVLGTPALFATAYGNVGSSIYYALGSPRSSRSG